MSRIKYHYNTTRLKFEKVERSWRETILRFLGFLATAAAFAFVIIVAAYTYLDSPKEKQLKRELATLKEEFASTETRLNQMEKVLLQLEERDNNIYRAVFEAEPSNNNERTNILINMRKLAEFERMDFGQQLISITRKMDNLAIRMFNQAKSYEEIAGFVKDKNKLMTSIPAIQPVSNKKLKLMTSGFGYRIDPIYKTIKMHEGLDFNAPSGTEIYSTGDGVVEEVNIQPRGYGNHIIINHGYGYKTLYAHMSKFNIRQGAKVTRGQLIGYVGSTGKSTGSHLHYEVIKDGKKVNPINFLFNDLSPAEFEQLVNQANTNNQSYD